MVETQAWKRIVGGLALLPFLAFAIYAYVGMAFMAPPHLETVYLGPTGQTYHAPNCMYLQQPSKSISYNEAARRGFRPCPWCDP
jgi:hypothetical protein